jgi:hypothetical protein
VVFCSTFFSDFHYHIYICGMFAFCQSLSGSAKDDNLIANAGKHFGLTWGNLTGINRPFCSATGCCNHVSADILIRIV